MSIYHDTKESFLIEMKKWFEDNPISGEEFHIKNLNAFCREKGLAPGNLYKTVTGIMPAS